MLSSLALSVYLSANPVTAVQVPTLIGSNDFYPGNRAPLAATPMTKLPVGSVTAKGWLAEYLKRQRSGMTGHLPEISFWLKKEGNAWFSKDGSGRAGWEEVPYWLKGYISLAYQLKDEAMIREAKTWIEAALASQRSDGDFGPNQKFEDGSRDFWGNMLMLECLRTYYEATSDHRVIELMTRYFHYQLDIPDGQFLTGYWQKARGADNLASIFWLYNITGDKKLLDLAEKNHRCTMNWSMKDTLPDWHNVNVAESFDEPGIFYQISKDRQNLQSAYDNFSTIRKLYGQVPGGMYGADENARKGFSDPRQAVETCGIIEQMLSDEELLAISGDTKWADHCENVAFNTYPAAVTPDFTALRYLTSPNMVTSDAFNHAPGYQNSGPMTLFNPLSHRCCQHNHAMGWPYFSEHLWMATNDNGLVAALYSASTVRAKVGKGTIVTIQENSNYPFEDQIHFSVDPGKIATRFPIYLRVPSWCANPTLRINGRTIAMPKGPKGYLRVEQTWKRGDTMALNLPMKISTTLWAQNKNALSVNYGPLTFSLKIKEQVTKSDSTKAVDGDSHWSNSLDTSKWPAYSYTAQSPWNYALAIDPQNPAKSLTIIHKPWPKSNFPFTLGDVPISIQAKGSILSKWQLDRSGIVAPLQPSPTVSSNPTQKIELVPMGAARLRISAFPWLAKNGKAWADGPKPLPYKASASHTFGGDTTDALCDGVLPSSSNDESIARFTWWDHKGTTEWVEYDFGKPKEIKGVDVYWFDDTGSGQCRVPNAWSIQVLVDGLWTSVRTSDTPDCLPNQFNRVDFDPVKATKIRLNVLLQRDYSGGILEWRIR